MRLVVLIVAVITLWIGAVLWYLLYSVTPPPPPATPVLVVPAVTMTTSVFVTMSPVLPTRTATVVPTWIPLDNLLARTPLPSSTATLEPTPTPTLTPTPTRVPQTPVQRG